MTEETTTKKFYSSFTRESACSVAQFKVALKRPEMYPMPPDTHRIQTHQDGFLDTRACLSTASIIKWNYLNWSLLSSLGLMQGRNRTPRAFNVAYYNVLSKVDVEWFLNSKTRVLIPVKMPAIFTFFHLPRISLSKYWDSSLKHRASIHFVINTRSEKAHIPPQSSTWNNHIIARSATW